MGFGQAVGQAEGMYVINSAGHFRLLERTKEPTGTSACRMEESVITSGRRKKIEKVVRFGAFWCMTCAGGFGGAQQVVVCSRPGRTRFLGRY